jgi:uncharacterized protein YndB with AHSA1/START domain
MSDAQQLRINRTIAAPPDQVFALLADPDRHTGLDGAGMLRGLASEPVPITATGQAFVMNMNQDGIGDYQMRNEVVSFEPGRRIGWAPSIHPPGSLRHVIGDLDPSGHVYEWELEPTSDGRTTVTHTYDWSGVTDPKALPLYPRVSEQQLTGTLDRIEVALR